MSSHDPRDEAAEAAKARARDLEDAATAMHRTAEAADVVAAAADLAAEETDVAAAEERLEAERLEAAVARDHLVDEIGDLAEAHRPGGPPPGNGGGRGGGGGGGGGGGRDGAADGERDRPVPVEVVNDSVDVRLGRTAGPPTYDQILWAIIRRRTRAIAFNRFRRFVDGIMCGDAQQRAGYPQELQEDWANLRPFGLDAYEALRKTTEIFLMQEVGVIPPSRLFAGLDPTEEGSRMGRRLQRRELRDMRNRYYLDLGRDGRNRLLPYFDQILQKLPELEVKDPDDVNGECYGVLPGRVTGPLAIELIWSYWHEEGMLVQALNAVALRFQNWRTAETDGPDPLARLEIDPLRPLNNFLWGYVQQEWDRLSVVRRAYEYDHEYGLALIGKAVPPLRTADTRSKFLEAFHNLLNLCSVFFKEDDDTTVIADPFPIMHALREVHLILAEGAHNQFGDLPWTARVEMLVQQWLLARPEMREFLGGRVMVPYREPWMDRVDTVKTMMGWTDVGVTHFHDLAVFGEQILLSIRYGAWTLTDDPDSARNWVRYWRPEIQGYLHAYRAVTGVDLTETVDPTLPAVHLLRRLPGARPELSGPVQAGLPAGQRRGVLRPGTPSTPVAPARRRPGLPAPKPGRDQREW